MSANDRERETRNRRFRCSHAGTSVTSFQTTPCFFILLKKVLRGMPRSRAATLLLPSASFKASMSRWRSYATNSAFQSSPGERFRSAAFQPRAEGDGDRTGRLRGLGGRLLASGDGRRGEMPRSSHRRRAAAGGAGDGPAGAVPAASRRASRRSVGEDDRPLQHVLELADVAGPVIGHQGLDRLGVQVGDQLAGPCGVEVQEVDGQLEDVLPALAQGRGRAGRSR